MPETLVFSEINKGWNGEFSFIPDGMCRLNNKFFTIKGGQLWQHYDKDNLVRNNFYGTQYTSKVTTVINQAPSEDKIFKNLVLEGNKPWKVGLKTNMTESTLEKEEFNQKESRQFAYLRKNEDENDLRGHAAQGIGVITSFNGLNVNFTDYISSIVSVGDTLYQLNGANNEAIGVITNIQNNTATVDAIQNTPVNGYYSFAKKDSRLEGAEMRGYFLEVELENDDTDFVELYAVNTNAVKSFVNDF